MIILTSGSKKNKYSCVMSAFCSCQWWSAKGLALHTNNKYHLHRQTANISCLQKSRYNAGIKVIRFIM